MFYLGCHLSAAKGYVHMANEAISIEANVFQFFTRNPRGGKAKDIDEKDVADFLEIKQQHGFGPIMAHAPYTLNPCGDDKKVRAFAFEVMADDLLRMEYTPFQYYNFHPGNHVGQGIEKGIERVVELLDAILKKEQTTLVLLETMSGKGTELGGRFEELRAIIDRVALPEKLGVCFDTCHTYDAGYDIVHDLDGVLKEFDRVIGLERLKAVHLNDSKNPLVSRKDRHEKIGQGTLGLDTIRRVVTHPLLCDLPFYLETPNDVAGYGEEIRLLREIRPD